MFKKNIIIFLIFANLSLGAEKLPEVNIQSLSTAKIIKKEEKIEKKQEVKKNVTSYPLRQSTRFTSGLC
jgi:hypothetical protein